MRQKRGGGIRTHAKNPMRGARDCGKTSDKNENNLWGA